MTSDRYHLIFIRCQWFRLIGPSMVTLYTTAKTIHSRFRTCITLVVRVYVIAPFRSYWDQYRWKKPRNEARSLGLIFFVSARIVSHFWQQTHLLKMNFLHDRKTAANRDGILRIVFVGASVALNGIRVVA